MLVVVFARSPARRAASPRSSASAPAGAWATRCSSRPRWRPSSASASGGLGGAIILYEAALGLGIASGPLLGGLLGGISWRGPFFGTAVLMAIGFVAIRVLLGPGPEAGAEVVARGAAARARPPRPALDRRSSPLFYNFGFFMLLAYTPFLLGLGAHALGFIFFGWGLLLALTSRVRRAAARAALRLVPVLGVTLRWSRSTCSPAASARLPGAG